MARPSSSWLTGLRRQRPAEQPGLIYSRINNPDLEILEDRLALWEGAETGLVFSTGMAAISTTLLTLLRPGDTIVHSEPVYGGTEFLIRNILPKFGITPVAFGGSSGRRSVTEAIAKARGQGPTGIIYVGRRPIRPTRWSTSAPAPRRRRRSPARNAGGHWWRSTTRCWGRCGNSRWSLAPTWRFTR